VIWLPDAPVSGDVINQLRATERIDMNHQQSVAHNRFGFFG
jgi:hypothetical protein